VFGWPLSVGSALLAAQDSGPAIVFAATTAGGPLFPVRLTEPATMFPTSSMLPELPVRVTEPKMTLLPHGEPPPAEPILTDPLLPLTDTGPAIVLSHTETCAAPLVDSGP
jgi:hypothetical protein